MDKTSGLGEQLNKAYEAYRQACMDRDQARKDLQQKSENYEQQIREHQKKIAHQNSLIMQLKSHLRTVNCGNAHGMAPVSKVEDSESRRHEIPLNLTYEQLQDQVKLLIQREKYFMEQLENERFRFESFINSKNEEMQQLRTRLTKVNEKLVLKDEQERKERSKKHPAGSYASTNQEPEREDLEKIVQDVKDEFLHICKLTREQKAHLSRLTNRETAKEIQFSMPIQCTDNTDEQTEGLFKPQVIKNACVTSITPRGPGHDEEDDCSVESLSKFSVKFPPTDIDSVFLQSSPEKSEASIPVRIENVLQEKCDMELGDHISRPGSGSGDVNCTLTAVQNLTHTDKTKPSNHVKTFMQSTQDQDPFLEAGDHGEESILAFIVQSASDESNISLETSGRPVRGPQQSLWKPYQNQDGDLQIQACQMLDHNQPGVCEFCQKVFPPGSWGLDWPLSETECWA
ncbi:TRAF family member-associated NF-kappa-B activator isoform X2 [Microcaecilia unicolor]|uniref:TRAF family member-associated NF-kappa-B activator isoform X2 n=1 Tax=Microcaecilia unicolor TaxID=1415580 RepID=A0A6P7YNW3_9AMPH|nr:TRAF family member-associated NF-kappa-B activator isoform X2 [Microcaecilia unicolor]